MKYIDTLKEGMHISEVYLCKSKQIAQTKAGKDYGNLVLQDKTGTVDSKVWDLTSPGVGSFDVLDYVRVDADVTIFQGNRQLNVRRIRRADPGEYKEEDYLPVSKKDIGRMYAELLSYVNSLRNPCLKELAASFFQNDEEFSAAFRAHSAAKSVHHGFVGGLLEHTLSVVKICDFLAGHYPQLNRDLLVSAAMFHDIGKVKELSLFPENDYTDDGQLIGHIIIGVDMVGARIRGISGFPARLETELKHCILAHHGELEYGSPKKPALLEALVLSFADNLDAKTETMTEALNSGGDNSGWVGYNRFLETNIRKTSE